MRSLRPGLASGALALLLGGGLAVHGYAADQGLAFWCGLLSLGAGALWTAHAGFERAPSAVVLAAHGLAAFVLGLALVEGGWAAWRAARDEPASDAIRFDGSWDPAALRRWQQQAVRGWLALLGTLHQRDPAGVYPLRPIPGARVVYRESEYRINSLGLRGPELEIPKGARYRIVATGESTTFGATLAADDEPWPDVLGALLVEQLDCARPIQVVNAGMVAWNLAHSLRRLEDELLVLEPDMVISYHGHNGLKFILRDLPPVAVEDPPRFPKRPSRLLARVEFTLALREFRASYRVQRAPAEMLSETELRETEYARLYRQLIDLGRRTGFVPVLCTFNMAVSRSSPPEAVEFYALVSPAVDRLVAANAQHTQLLEALHRETGVHVVDTSAGLDGAYDAHFIDLVHFTQSGRDLLARHILDGILPVLLADPELACRPRS